jgi:preprotein translocase subunit SecG
MVQSLQILSAVVVIIILIPQTTKVNYLLRKFYESGVFGSYGATKRFVTRLTWGSIGVFFVLTYLAARVG